MATKILCADVRGVEGRALEVQVAVSGGLPSFSCTSMKEASWRETRVRVQAALANQGVSFPTTRIDVFIGRPGFAPAPGDVDGLGFDLPIALALAGFDHPGVAAVAELSLVGDLRPVRGVLSRVEALKAAGATAVIVAEENVAEAILVEGIKVHTAKNLADAMRMGTEVYARTVMVRQPVKPLDMADVAGNKDARRALEVAAVSGQNVLLVGPPGAGKTMLARRFVGLLPSMTAAEKLEVTRVHSAAGLNIGGGLIQDRPFRAPHHSTTPPGLVGGGAAQPRPGEASLAHCGVLFLDELPEFSKVSIEALGAVAHDGSADLMRASGTVRLPARCQIIASASPCPCGWFGSEGTTRRCRCNPADVARFQERIRHMALVLNIGIVIHVDPVDLRAFDTIDRREARDSTAKIQERVIKAQAINLKRVNVEPAMQGALGEGWPVTKAARDLFSGHGREGALSAAALDRLMTTAFSVASLDGGVEVAAIHVVEAIHVAGKV